jgi:hypothetical protein
MAFEKAVSGGSWTGRNNYSNYLLFQAVSEEPWRGMNVTIKFVSISLEFLWPLASSS